MRISTRLLVVLSRQSAQQRAIHLALLGECLAVGDTYADDLPARLKSETLDWQGLCWLAGSGLVTPALAGALQRKGLFTQLPDDVQEVLSTIQSLNRERNQMLREQLINISQALNQIGIQPVLLKGAIALTEGQYPGAEDRVIGDLDLLVLDEQREAATDALLQIGYQVHDDNSKWVLPSHIKNHHHGFPLMHQSLPIKVELHRRIQHHHGDDALLCQGMVTEAYRFFEGSTVQIPDVATRLLHNMLHCQISDHQRAKKVINLRQLLEFSALTQYYRDTNALHIPDLLDRLRSSRRVVLAEYWTQAAHWFKTPYPDDLPRLVFEAQYLWLLENVAIQPGWHRLFASLYWLSVLPGRLPNLVKKLWLMPGYFPVKLKAVLTGQSS